MTNELNLPFEYVVADIVLNDERNIPDTFVYLKDGLSITSQGNLCLGGSKSQLKCDSEEMLQVFLDCYSARIIRLYGPYSVNTYKVRTSIEPRMVWKNRPNWLKTRS